MSRTAVVDVDDSVSQLGQRAEPDAVFTVEDAGDHERLARAVQELQRGMQAIQREWKPRVVWFRDRTLPSSGTVTLRHAMGGRVEWAVYSPHGAVPALVKHASSDDDVLVLSSSVACTATILVVEAG
jgi:LmbE family N-acetylglucosaminyl deacetylase